MTEDTKPKTDASRPKEAKAEVAAPKAAAPKKGETPKPAKTPSSTATTSTTKPSEIPTAAALLGFAKQTPITPGANDILFGKNVASLNHAGTKQFEKLILQFVDPYKDFKSRNEGFRVLDSIRGHISHRGGRFLQQNEFGKYFKMEKSKAMNEIEGALNQALEVRETQRKAAEPAPKPAVKAAPTKPTPPAPNALGPKSAGLKPATIAPANIAPLPTAQEPYMLAAQAALAAARKAHEGSKKPRQAPILVPAKPPQAPIQPKQAPTPAPAKTHPVPTAEQVAAANMKYNHNNGLRPVRSNPMVLDADVIARGGVEIPFPWKLHEMLEDTYNAGQEWIVSWQPHGRSFLVHKPNIFVEKIMPTYFNQSKFASFQRQLNLYGFQRLSSGKDKGAYYHKAFLRGQVDLCHGVIRQKIKGTKVRRKPHTEPDFYNMTFMPDISTGTRTSRAAIENSIASGPPKPATARYHPTTADAVRAKEQRQPTFTSTKNRPPIVMVPLTDRGHPTRTTTTSPPIKASSSNASGDSTSSGGSSHAKNTLISPRTVVIQQQQTQRTITTAPPSTKSSQRSSPPAQAQAQQQQPQRVAGQKRPAPAATPAPSRAEQQSINDLRVQVSNLAQQASAKDADIRWLRQELTANSQMLQLQTETMNRKDLEIHRLTEELAAKDRKLAKLETDRGKVIKGLFVKETWENMDTFRDNLYI